MPIRKVKSGYKWGNQGKIYPTREGAVRQMRAAFSAGYTGKSNDFREIICKMMDWFQGRNLWK